MKPDVIARFDRIMEEAAPRCSVGRMLASFDDETAEVVRRALAAPRVSTTRLKSEFGQIGFGISRTTIQAHRDLTCVCAQ